MLIKQTAKGRESINNSWRTVRSTNTHGQTYWIPSLYVCQLSLKRFVTQGNLCACACACACVCVRERETATVINWYCKGFSNTLDDKVSAYVLFAKLNAQGYSKSHVTYSWLSLSRPRLSRITAYLEVKIWSLPKDENLTIGHKILWKRGEIAPKEQFLLFSTIFSIYLEFQGSIYIYIC